MGGAAVSSADTGAFSSIELNAIQRSNPEMQKKCRHSWIGRKQ
jgi:phosphoribosylformylglycinamidine synthase